MKTILVTEQTENQRVDKYIMKILCEASKGFIYKMFRKKNILLNEQRIEGHEIIKNGDVIQVYFSDETYEKLSHSHRNEIKPISRVQLGIVYEDENVLICCKPTNLLSQPDGKGDNLVNRIENYLRFNDEKSEPSGFHPGICNRLDRNTSGLVIAGKTIRALQVINEAFAAHQVDKRYITVVKGKLTESGILQGYLDKDHEKNTVSLSSDGDYIHTEYVPICWTDHYTLLEVRIFTGKTHQIRLHLQSIGFPIVGDEKYGDHGVNQWFFRKYGLSHQLLHAYRISFTKLQEPLQYLEHQVFKTRPEEIFVKIMDEILEITPDKREFF